MNLPFFYLLIMNKNSNQLISYFLIAVFLEESKKPIKEPPSDRIHLNEPRETNVKLFLNKVYIKYD